MKGIDFERGPRLSNGALVHEAALEGVGVALLLRPLIDTDIEEGRLVVPFPQAAPTPYAYYLVTPENIADHPAADTFRLWMLGQAEKQARRALARRYDRRPCIAATCSFSSTRSCQQRCVLNHGKAIGKAGSSQRRAIHAL